MNEDYNFSAYIYDPMLYLVLRPIRKVVLNELMEHKDKAILDLCCGTGNQLKFLSKNGFSNLHCLDLSEAMLHEKDRETQESMLDEAYRLLKEDAFILIVDFVFDDKTKKMGSLGIRLIEKMAGGEHYSNFKKYIQNNGLASLMKEDKFKFIKNHRMAFNGVTVSKYQKI